MAPRAREAAQRSAAERATRPECGRQDEGVIVSGERLKTALERACEDAGVEPAQIVAWVVEGERPEAASPIAYLAPASYVSVETAAVFRAVGSIRAHEHHLRQPSDLL